MKFFQVLETGDALNLDFFIPTTANALSLEAARELGRLPKAYGKSKKPVIVSSVHPRVFCSGGNLSDYKKLSTKAAGLKVNREIQKHLQAFAAWPVPKLAIVEGDVLGGGMEWLARFDFRWGAAHTLFAFWQRRIGLSSGWGGGKAWSLKIGEEKVRQLLMEGRVLGAQEALRLGLIDRVVCSWKIRAEAAKWAAQMHQPHMRELSRWKAAKEASLFSSLWMGPGHSAILRQWKG